MKKFVTMATIALAAASAMASTKIDLCFNPNLMTPIHNLISSGDDVNWVSAVVTPTSSGSLRFKRTYSFQSGTRISASEAGPLSAYNLGVIGNLDLDKVGSVYSKVEYAYTELAGSNLIRVIVHKTSLSGVVTSSQNDVPLGNLGLPVADLQSDVLGSLVLAANCVCSGNICHCDGLEPSALF